MLLIFLFTLSSCKTISVSVKGYIPEQLHGVKKNYDPDLYLIEESFRYKPKIVPENFTEYYFFESKIPQIFVYQRNDFLITDPLVFVPQTINGYSSIIKNLFLHNISVSLRNFNASFLISNNPNEENINYFMIEGHTFDFLINSTSKFYVFAKNKTTAYSIFDINILNVPIFYYLTEFEIVCFIIIISIHLKQHFTKISLTKGLNLWFFDQNGNVLLGDSFDRLDRTSKNLLLKNFKHSKNCHLPCYETIKVVRNKEFQSFICAFCRPFGKYFLACICEEFFPNNKNRKYNVEFKSNTVQTKSKPVFKITTLLNYRPIDIKYKLDNNITCDYSLPGSVLMPFQPFGRILTTIISMFYTVSSHFQNYQTSKINFSQLVHICCSTSSIKQAFFIKNGTILYSYKESNTKAQKKINSHLGNPLYTEKFKSIQFKEKPFQIKNFLEEGDLCYFHEVAGIQMVMQFDHNIDFIFISISMPLIALCLAYAYQINNTKDQSIKYQRIISTLSFSKSYALFEMNSKELRRICGNKLIAENQAVLQILKNIAHQAQPCIQYIEQIGNKDPDKKANPLMPKWISVSSDMVHYESVNEDIYTFLVQDVTSLKEHELTLLKSRSEKKKALSVLNSHLFKIVNGRAKMEDDLLFRELNIPKEEYLDQIVHRQDTSKILHGKSMIRLKNSDHKYIWYASICDKSTQGFVFCVDKMITTRSQLETSDKGIQMTATSSSLIFWTVNPKKDTVHSLFMQPTIWDVLSVDRDTKFSKFVDFIYEEDKQLFNENYQALKTGKTHQWSGFIRLLRISGTYEWHLVVFTLSKTQTLHCLALNVNSQKENEIKLRESQKLRDLLLSSGKLTLWKFNDNHNPIEKLNYFDPNVTKVIEMNWTFVETQVHEDYRHKFYEGIMTAIEFDETFAMNVPLLLDKEIWVSISGRARSNNRELVGVCIDITDLQKAYSDLEIEKKRAEEANKQKTVFLANISHEIRTPMNGIFGILDVLALKNLTPDQSDLVEMIKGSSTQLMKLVDDTLNLSKIEQGEIESSPAIFDFGKLIEPIFMATASRASLNNIKFNVKISKGFPFLVYGDSQLFTQILNNLLSNALKFTKKGHIDVSLQWTDDERIEYLTLEVADSGIGITKEQKKVIFHRFQQADASTQRLFGGTGLGLALVQEICKFLGGSVKVKSKFGQGTRFIVELPFESIYRPFSPEFKDGKKHVVLISTFDDFLKHNLAEWIQDYHYEVKSFASLSDIEKFSPEIIIVERQKKLCQEIEQKIKTDAIKCSICQTGESSPFQHKLTSPLMPHRLYDFLNECRYRKIVHKSEENTNQMDQAKSRILVVEDNKTNQFVMSKILSSYGCTYEIANNGKDAIDILDNSTNGFDMIFMDCQMPVLDGISATKIIRDSNKSYSKIPIVALTASAVEGDEETCLNAGMNAYLAKPVRYPQVTSMIKKFT